MNDDLQSYLEPELEARVVALVMGEASPFEREELERLMAERPRLSAYKEQLERLHGALAEAQQENDDEDWKLSDERRAKVFEKIEERKGEERIEARRDRSARFAQRKLLLTCAACLVLTLVIIVLGQPLVLRSQKAAKNELVAYSAEAELAALDEEIMTQRGVVQDRRKDLTVQIQQYGIPYFDDRSSNGVDLSLNQEAYSEQKEQLESATRRLVELETRRKSLDEKKPGDSYDQSFSKMLTEVDEAWESAAPAAEMESEALGPAYEEKEQLAKVSESVSPNARNGGLNKNLSAYIASGNEGGKDKPAGSAIITAGNEAGSVSSGEYLRYSDASRFGYRWSERPLREATGGTVGLIMQESTSDDDGDPFADAGGGQNGNFFLSSEDDSDPFAGYRMEAGGSSGLQFSWRGSSKSLPDSYDVGGRSVDQSWDEFLNIEPSELPLYSEKGGRLVDPVVQKTVDQLDQIVIPEVNFENTTVEEAVAFIEKQTQAMDATNGDGDGDGISVQVDKPRTELDGRFDLGDEIDPSQTVIRSLKLKDVPAGVALQYIAEAAKLRYKVDENGVTFSPLTNSETSDLQQSRWDLDPAVTQQLQEAADQVGSVSEVLKQNGVSFPRGAGVSLLADSNTLIVRNSETNLDLVNGMIEAADQVVVQQKQEREADWLQGDLAPEEAETSILPPVDETPVIPDPIKKEQSSFETSTATKTDSTFSLNVSDVSYKLAKAALAGGNWPEATQVRPEEFVNALDYEDQKPTQAEKVACQLEQAAHPFMPQRNLMRIAMSTASLGRQASTPLRLTILLDQSGSMERADRAESLKRAFALLAAQLQPQDEVTLVGFARQPRLLAERVKGNEVAKLAQFVVNPLTEGGTNLEEALSSGLGLAKQQYLDGAQNRVILLTDGAANLGDASPASLSNRVELMRRSDISFDACGVGADGLNDDVLSALTKQGDGRYYFLDRPEDADEGFARQIAGALRPAAKNVKVQVIFNPDRVASFKLYGFEKHQLAKEDFRNDAVDAAEMAAEESGVALYHYEPRPEGRGEVGTVSVRFLDTASSEMVERTWTIPYEPQAEVFDKADPRLRLASVAGLFAEKLKGSPVGERVELKKLRQEAQGLAPNFHHQARFKELQEMLQQAGN